MLYILLFILSAMPVQAVYGMLGAPLTSCPVVSNSSFTTHRAQSEMCLIQPTCPQPYNSTLTLDEIHALPLNIRAAIVRDNVLKAVDAGDTDAVVADFSGWMNWIMPREYYRAAAAYTLLHAAHQSPKKTGAIVKDLLTRVSISELIEPDQLVKAAMDNNHLALLERMQKDTPAYMAGTLALEIVAGNPNRVQALLKAGVAPVNNPALRLPHVLLQVALDVFAVPNKVLPTTRLAVIDLLLKHTKVGAIPASYSFDLSKVPAALQEEIAIRIKQKQLSSSTALIEVIDSQETPLHVAAAKKDYARCFEYLTQWSGPLNKQELVPFSTIIVLNIAKKDSPAFQNAAKAFAKFPMSFQKLLETRLKMAKDQLLAQDGQGRTPLQVAQQQGASRELLELLDPKNQQDAKIVTVFAQPSAHAHERVIIPRDVDRIPVMSKLDPKKDKVAIRALTSTHGKLIGLITELESLKQEIKELRKNKMHNTAQIARLKALEAEVRVSIVPAHAKLLGILDKLENSLDRGVSETIILNLQKRTGIEEGNLKVNFASKPIDNPTGPAYKPGDFMVEDGDIYIVSSAEKIQ